MGVERPSPHYKNILRLPVVSGVGERLLSSRGMQATST